MLPAPYPIANVPESCLPGMFAPLHETLDSRLEYLDERPESHARDMEVGLFRELRETLDESAFRAIQTEFLSEPPTEPRVGHLKYIEPVIWTADKLATCLQLGLDEQQPLKILDICTGPAHWQLAARHFGHSVVATELPELIGGDSHRGRFYDAMCDLHRVSPLPLRIEPMVPVRDVGNDYDLVTLFMAIFNGDEEGNGWTEVMWRFFLKDIAENILAPGGGLHMRLSRQLTGPDIWAFLKSHATEANDRNMDIRFKDMSWAMDL